MICPFRFDPVGGDRLWIGGRPWNVIEAQREGVMLGSRTILYLVTEDWYFWSHRLPIARAARDRGARVIVASRMAAHEERIREEGFEAVHVSFDRSGINPLQDVRTLAAIEALYRRTRPDIVHHVAAKPVIYGSLAARAASVPVVINAMAGLGFLFTGDSTGRRIARAVFERGLQAACRGARFWTILQNEDDWEIFRSLGFPPDRLALIAGSGVDVNFYRPTPPVRGGTPVALCVARMLRDKGICELVEAARILRSRDVAIDIHLVGGADVNPTSIPARDLQAWAEEGIVRVGGHVDDLRPIYASASIAVLPSYREGLPKALLEAAACGLPLVATDVPGCRSICRDGETGILVPPRDAPAIAGALERLAHDPKERLRLGRAARIAVVEKFSVKTVAEQTLALYEHALELHRFGRG